MILGNVIHENIEVDLNFLNWCYNNQIQVNLKNGDYGFSIKYDRSSYNKEIVSKIYSFYISGDLYPGKFYKVFGLKMTQYLTGVFQRCNLKTLNKNELLKVYGDDISRTAKETFVTKYGVDNPSKSPEIRKKISQSVTEETKRLSAEKRRQTLKAKGKDWSRKVAKSKYGTNRLLVVDYYYKMPEINKSTRIKKWMIDFVTSNYKTTQSRVILQKLKLYKRSNESQYEKKVEDLLISMNLKYCKRVRKFRNANGNKFELDFIVNEDTAIEVDGLYWHSTEFKDENYHIEKFEVCKSNNIKLISITDDEIRRDINRVRDMITHTLKINVRDMNYIRDEITVSNFKYVRNIII